MYISGTYQQARYVIRFRVDYNVYIGTLPGPLMELDGRISSCDPQSSQDSVGPLCKVSVDGSNRYLSM